MVDAVAVRGNKVIASDALLSIVVTERTGLWRRWFGWNTGALTCLDSATLRDDQQRVVELYEDRGYPGTTVASSVARHGANRARVTFVVTESAPVLVDSVTVAGLPEDAADARALERLLSGRVLDDSVVRAVADSVQSLVLNAGYARAAPVTASMRADVARHRGTVSFVFAPGRLTHVGDISVRYADSTRTPALPERDVRSLLRVSRGDRLSARALSASQRDLFATELYRAIRVERAATDPASDTVSLIVHLAEGERRRARVGAGWGTLDCFRAQTRLVEQRFLGSAHRLELNGRLAKIGVGAPFSGLASLCAARVRDDPFSRRLNYYLGATVNFRGVAGARLRPVLTLYSERRSELAAYEQSTDLGAVLSVARAVGARTNLTLQYQYVDARTAADGAVSCERFGFCRVEDVASFLIASPLHAVGASLARNPLLPTDDPVSGGRWQLEVRQGFTRIARTRTLNFTRVLAEAAAYRPLGPRLVLATRAQFGFVFAPNDRSYLLPPPERFYSGGQSTVRGYDQNSLGPGSYIVDAYRVDTLPGGTLVGVAQSADGYRRLAPSGGNAMWLANVELRTRRGWPAGLLRWVVFVDAGRVWNTNDVFSVTNAAPRITPGAGIRLLTPLGPFRVDVGYNADALEPGPAFFVQRSSTPTVASGRAVCVSPGTTDPLTLAPGAGGAGFCPATFLPARRHGLLPRLAFQFSIGHAF